MWFELQPSLLEPRLSHEMAEKQTKSGWRLSAYPNQVGCLFKAQMKMPHCWPCTSVWSNNALLSCSGSIWFLDERIHLSAVNRPAETLPHAKEDKTIADTLHWDSRGASPSQTALACLNFPWHLMSQSECVFRPLGGGGGKFPGGNFWGEGHN